jgi:hypothetical protein
MVLSRGPPATPSCQSRGCPSQGRLATEVVGCSMLAKCSNPSCFVIFRSLQDGKLFRLESDPVLRADNSRVEYFWLCGHCSSTMTLRLGGDGTVVTVPLSKSSILSDRDAPFSYEQKKGLLLRSVSSRLTEHLRDRRGTGVEDENHAA